MAYGSNPWDNSSILLSNQAGANMARGIEQVGTAFSKGVQGYFERKQRTEKEEATVDWINGNEQAVNALFPQLANVKDPAERRKAIKAGIKGAGLENLVQVQGFMEQQAAAKRQQQFDAEMNPLKLSGARLQNQHAQQLVSDSAAEGRALRTAGGSGAALHDQIMRGVPAAQLDPNAEVDRAGVYMEMGGRSPQMIQALTKARPFSPQEFMTPSGLNMVQTSPNSFVPDPRVRIKPTEPKTGEYERIVAQLEDSGAFDKPEEKLTAKEKALMARMTALNKRGGMSAEELAASIVGGDAAGKSATDQTPAGDVPVVTPEQAAKLPKGTKFKTTDGRILIKN